MISLEQKRLEYITQTNVKLNECATRLKLLKKSCEMSNEMTYYEQEKKKIVAKMNRIKIKAKEVLKNLKP